MDTEAFWSANQPGFRFTSHVPGTREFYAAVELHRYELEPHIPSVVRFEAWQNRDVVEVGCGIATDGIQFARAGARYVGVDQSATALALARNRFELEGLSPAFFQSQATSLPLPDSSMDLLFARLIHHLDDTEAAVREFHRVLRPGGVALVMVYHRNSFNYWVSIMALRRLLASLLLLPGVSAAAARLTNERPNVLDGHRHLLRSHGMRYVTDRQLFLANNTDGPGNPLSKVYSRRDIEALFRDFWPRAVRCRYLNLRLYPGGARLARSRLALALERRVGWHLYVEARKPFPSGGE